MTPCYPHGTGAVQASPFLTQQGWESPQAVKFSTKTFSSASLARAPAWPLSASGPRAARQGQRLRQLQALSPGCLSQQEQGRAGDRGKLAAQTDRGLSPSPLPAYHLVHSTKHPAAAP